MDRKVIFILTFAIILIFGLYLTFGKKTKSEKKQELTQVEDNHLSTMKPTNNNLYPLGDPSNIWDGATSHFDDSNKKSYDEIISGLMKGEIIFTWEVWALRRKCPSDYTPKQCDASIIAYIEKNYSSPDKEKVKKLFESYFNYENEIRNLEISNEVKFIDKYEIIKNKRRELLGSETADIIFGLEESQVNFMEASQNFYSSTKDLDPEERVKKYQELKSKTYGRYLDSVSEREDKFDQYRLELELREKQFEGISENEKETSLYKLEKKYFGKEKADLMAANRKAEKDLENNIVEYEKQESEFLRNNSSLSDEEKEAKLKEIREKLLGEEEAASYLRRKQLEKEVGSF
ncbi:MAG: lipase [Leptospiraceae bacterium]|nr:lipase [Leptospiraceae bacterium]